MGSVIEAGGELRLGTEGIPVDWLVVMHRLPGTAMLEKQIKSSAVEYQRVTAAADLLARFYLDAASVRLSGNQYLERLREGIDDHYQQLIYSLPEDRVKRVRDQQMTLIEKHSAVFADRAKAGILVEEKTEEKKHTEKNRKIRKNRRKQRTITAKSNQKCPNEKRRIKDT